MSDELPPGVAIETIYVVEGTYGPDAADRRKPVRAEHLARVARLRDEGIVLEAGGYLDFSSALMLVRAPDAAAALALFADDVYVRTGVWTELRVRALGRVVRR